ncbi:peptide chain release factor N(5)-glutamine methyltransferase [Parasphingorhabdus sp.]|uniref:peptide chain release factor N(5)-glutamine methyltransferase n=1 Tax=Parasphingorhabdus sp. TaxID=2709688 RepID=UPI003BB0B0D3
MGDRQQQTPPLQGRGKGWGLSKAELAVQHGRAKEMRANPTEPEKRLWRSLSNSQLSGFKFRRQAVVSRYIADFLCPQKRLVVEIDGDTHDADHDSKRDQQLRRLGYETLRFSNDDVMKNVEGVLEQILDHLQKLDQPDGYAPHPNPSPEGEGLSLALQQAAQALEAVSDTPRLDAELLMAHALGMNRQDLLLHLPKLDVPDGFSALLERRKAHEPVAHIVGEREFWSLPFQVSSDVLIPRPDSEILIETAVQWGAGHRPNMILDLGTGSGALLLAALSEFPEARGVGMDASAPALAMAHNNADRLELSDRARFLLQDWTAANWTQSLGGPFDLILANPPYVSTKAKLSREVTDYEPHAALFAGAEGMDDYHIIIPALDALLAENGAALLEIGFDQAEPVTKLAEKHRYAVECKQDLGGNDRLLILRRAPA